MLPPATDLSVPRRSGLLALTDGVRALFPLIGVSATVTKLGWKQYEQILTQGPGGANRVSFMPGKKPGGGGSAMGYLSRADQPTVDGQQVIATWHRIATVSVWACDTSDISNEELQEAAFTNLLESTIFAMHAAVDPVSEKAVGRGALTWNNAAVVATKPPTNLAFGLEALIEFEHLEPLFAPTGAQSTPQLYVQRVPQ